MHRLQTVILEHTKVLMDVMECCADLDWYDINLYTAFPLSSQFGINLRLNYQREVDTEG